MKIIILFLTLIFTTTSTMNAQSTKVPSSDRSEKAIEKVKPDLETALKEIELEWGAPIYIRIFKEDNALEVWVQKQDSFLLFKTYEICTYGRRGVGPKTKQGDKRAPEGFYYVNSKRMNPWSDFHLSFNLGYPNAYDRAHNYTGSALMVHGSCVSAGCYAMRDSNIEEIYSMADAALNNGQSFFRVHIFPFRMTDENMQAHMDSDWYDFWENLKEGYDYFEANGVPPNVTVMGGDYVFE
ncbi:L,D-transpeptidase family protein [Bacteroidota bacterium]